MNFTFSNDLLLDLVLQQAISQVLQTLVASAPVIANRAEPGPHQLQSPLLASSLIPIMQSPGLPSLSLSVCQNDSRQQSPVPQVERTKSPSSTWESDYPLMPQLLDDIQPALMQNALTGTYWRNEAPAPGPYSSNDKTISPSVVSEEPPWPLGHTAWHQSSDVFNSLEGDDLSGVADFSMPNSFAIHTYSYSTPRYTSRIQANTPDEDTSYSFSGPQSISTFSHNSPATPHTGYELDYDDQKNGYPGYQTMALPQAIQDVSPDQTFTSPSVCGERRQADLGLIWPGPVVTTSIAVCPTTASRKRKFAQLSYNFAADTATRRPLDPYLN